MNQVTSLLALLLILVSLNASADYSRRDDVQQFINGSAEGPIQMEVLKA